MLMLPTQMRAKLLIQKNVKAVTARVAAHVINVLQVNAARKRKQQKPETLMRYKLSFHSLSQVQRKRQKPTL